VKNQSLLLIKIGGAPAGDPEQLQILIDGIADATPPVVLVHGGGSQVSALSRALGHEPRFIDGIRQTGTEEMDIIDMGLSGLMNKKIVRMAASAGLAAVGISGADGGLLTAPSLGTDNRTARDVTADASIVRYLLEGGWFPVIAPAGSDTAGGTGVNINADDAAMALATALNASVMLFISDIPGVLDGPGGPLIPRLDRRSTEEMIDSGKIAGGMIPKVKNALSLTEQGVSRVIIGSIGPDSTLEDLLEERRGTLFTAEAGHTEKRSSK
jgi:acetylglutamate kinase